MKRILGAFLLVLFAAAFADAPAADDSTPGQNTHRLAGIGVVLVNDMPSSKEIHHYILIRSVQDGGPAMKMGVKAGDEIVAIDDYRVAGKNIQDVVNMHLRGEQDSVVQISVQRPGESELLTFTLVRKIIPTDHPRVAPSTHLS